MDATGRFADIVRRPSDEIPLDETALLIAAHAHPDLDLAAPLAELDRLAGAVDDATAAAVARTLFHGAGFTGNTVDYGDPSNSYLDDVLARRLGIPISLSVVMMEVGRRAGVRLSGVAMPGHFLVCPAGQPQVWFDPFHGGAQLDEAGCRLLYERERGGGTPFTGDFLDPVDARSILNRMLANLQHTLLQRRPAEVTWVLRLRLRIPGLSAGERRRLAGLLGGIGGFVEAARELDRLTAHVADDTAEEIAREAAKLRARAN